MNRTRWKSQGVETFAIRERRSVGMPRSHPISKTQVAVIGLRHLSGHGSAASMKRSGSRKNSGRKKSPVRRFKIGDHVRWNSEAGRVSGTITKVHKKNVQYKGYTHHATPDEPQYEIKSDKTDHVALHKGPALRRIR
jgi:hypothetical protein